MCLFVNINKLSLYKQASESNTTDACYHIRFFIQTEKEWSQPQARALTAGGTVFRQHSSAVPRHVPAGVEPVGAGTRTLFYTVGRPSPTYACLSKLSRKVIEDVSEFLPSISPYRTHPSPCFLDIRLVVNSYLHVRLARWY